MSYLLGTGTISELVRALATFSAAVALSSNLVAAAVVEDLLPRPQEIQVYQGACHLDPDKLVFDLTAPDKPSGKRLAQHVRETFDELGISAARQAAIHLRSSGTNGGYNLIAAANQGRPALPDWEPPPARPEGYQLHITTNLIAIGAASERGLFYGIQTLGQLLNRITVRGEKSLPCLEIRDWPGLPMRGYSEDYGRNQLPTISDHKRMIRFLARYKLNTYVWFIEPDHFVYQFDPAIGHDYDRFRFDEIRELVAYARRYYVEVIPTVELLGHMDGLLSHPRYRKLAEVEGTPDLCATGEDSFGLVRRIVCEIAPAFESKYFHCGLDESFQIGKGRSAPAVREKGLERVMADYYIRINDLVRSQGKTMMMYADIVLAHPGIIEMLPRNIVMMFWDYMPQEHYPLLDKLHKAGFQVASLSGLWDWSHLYPAYSFAFRNIEPLSRQSHEMELLGHFVSSWGDPVFGAAGMNLSELNTYGVAFAAALSWKPGDIPIAEFSQAFALDYYGDPGDGLPKALTTLAELQEDRVFYVRRFLEDTPANNSKSLAKAGEGEIVFWQRVKTSSEQAVRALKSARPARNQDQIQSLLLSARLNLFTADKAVALQAIAKGINQPGFDNQQQARTIEGLADRLEVLGQHYRAIYLASNRPINMRYIEKDFSRMVRQLRDLAVQVRLGTLK